MKFNINKLPYFTGLFIVSIYLCCINNTKDWEELESTINYDVIFYYEYLPATFIYKDLSLDFIDNNTTGHPFLIWAEYTKDGKKIIKTTCGMSYMYAPFFFIGHGMAYLLNYDTGGYSLPYRMALILGSLVYSLLSMFFLAKLLLKFFSPIISSITMLIVVLGSNLLYYSTFYPLISHAYSFCLITIFIYYSISWIENPNLKHSILIGCLLGLIALIRPTNIIISLLLILYKIENLKDIGARIGMFFKNYRYIIIAILAFILIWIPQMLYWKKITGHYMHYSYDIKEETFFFTDPKIMRGLFGFRKGWLIYSPIFIFTFIGLYAIWKKYKTLFFPILSILILHIWIVFSWWCWWYGGSYGMRPMIDMYPLFILPIAAFLSVSLNFNKNLKIGSYILVSLITIIGLFHTFKYHYGSIHYESMTKEALFNSYFSLKPKARFQEQLKTPDVPSAKRNNEKAHF